MYFCRWTLTNSNKIWHTLFNSESAVAIWLPLPSHGGAHNALQLGEVIGELFLSTAIEHARDNFMSKVGFTPFVQALQKAHFCSQATEEKEEHWCSLPSHLSFLSRHSCYLLSILLSPAGVPFTLGCLHAGLLSVIILPCNNKLKVIDTLPVRTPWSLYCSSCSWTEWRAATSLSSMNVHSPGLVHATFRT